MEERANDFGKIKNRPRSTKLNPKIDLSAMVSISFLLIIFFMVTIELSKPKAIELGLPDYSCEPVCGGCRHSDRVITLLLDDNNKIVSYRGLIEIPEEKPKSYKYGKEGIRKVLIMAKNKIEKFYGDDKGAIVIIKPGNKSNFGNLVDILDEMTIADIPTYAIVNDFTPQELNLLASN
jgi:biopolymer transport protein ExbD